MASGSIKWFSSAKGFGFILPADDGEDVFLHSRIVRASGLDPATLTDGTAVEYEPGFGKKGVQAIKVSLEKQST